MQRLSSLVTLLVFMFMLSWVAQSIQQEPPLRPKNGGSLPQPVPPGAAGKFAPERITLPHRDGHTLPELAGPEKPEAGSLQKNDLAAAESRRESMRGLEGKDDIVHFLLLGYSWDTPVIEIIIAVTLVPGREAMLTALDPNLTVELEGAPLSAGALFRPESGHAGLYRLIAETTGLEPQFYIDLNTCGFIEMVDLLGGVDYHASPVPAEAVPELNPGINRIDGAGIWHLLTDPHLETGLKESLLIELLIKARDVQDTRLGLSLLWTGYRNIKTDLGLSDLLQLRRVSQKISPTRVSLTEIKAP